MGTMIAASTVFNEGHKLPHFRERASHVGGRGEGRMLRADQHFLVFPLGKCAGKKRGWVCCLPTRCHGSAPRITVPLWHFYSKLSCFFHLSHPAAVAGSIRTKSLSLCLPRAYRQGFMSSSGMTGSPTGNWAAGTRWPTPPSLRAPEGHPQTFTAQ